MNSTSKKIFSIGGATFDVFIKTEDHSIITLKDKKGCLDWIGFDYGAKVRIEEVYETFGGGAANTSVAFSRMGLDAYFIGKVGLQYGDRVLQNLLNEGVKVDYAKKTSRDKTGFSTILNTFEGDRTVLAYAGANRHFTHRDLPDVALKTADWIFLNHIAKENSQIPQKILKILKKNPRIKLAWNPGHEQLMQGVKKWKELLAHTEVLLLNKEEAALFSGVPYRLAGIKQDDPKCHVKLPKSFLPPYADDVSGIIRELIKFKVKKVVVTDGRNGAQASDGKWIYFCPIVTHKRVDTLGAGDAFGSGFVTAVALGKNLKMALKYGTLNANAVVDYFGAQKGLLTHEQLTKQLKSLDISLSKAKINFLSSI